MREFKIPAVSVAVFEHYQLQWTHAWGLADVTAKIPATETTLFQAGSISKTGNALAVLEVVADGKLALDRPINEELVSWKLPDNELMKKTPVTLREILGHMAGTTVHGFPGYAVGAPVPTIQQVLDGTPPANTPAVRVDLTPGTTWRYSGGGVTISQLALTDQLKLPYPQILAQRVLQPLGMTHSTYEQPLPPSRIGEAAAGYHSDGAEVEGKRHTYPEMAAAGLWTTPSDLVRLFAEIARARKGESKLISKPIAMEMTTKSANVPDATGLGTFLVDKGPAKLFGHNGADEGFQAYALASLDDGYGVVIMTNSDNGSKIFDALFDAIAAEYHWPCLAPPIVAVALDPAQRAAFVGYYHTPESALIPAQVIDHAGMLELVFPFAKPRQLVAIAPDIVIDRDGGIRLHLDAGHALQLELPDGDHKVVGALTPAGSETPFLFELEAGHFDAAVADLRALKPGKPELDQLNNFAYGVLNDDPAKAVAIFQLAVAVFPTSANAEDSLGEAYVAVHDSPHAITAYQQALALLDADPFIPADNKPRIRKHAQDGLAKLQTK
jgi:CubicO group peptidase (beta-lactamase class C family)